MRLLEPNEVLLEGRWIKEGNKVVADDTTSRIEHLISSELDKLATSDDGWDVLYIDRRDGRMWELTYPHKDWHGGGPPSLTNVAKDHVQRKYRL